jgi:2-(1,2-epoxy-1,2-dihydrophenyl)acetyl-CoA isomerase
MLAEAKINSVPALLFEKRDGVAWITFNRPKVKNAISGDMTDRMVELFTSFNTDDEVKVVVLRGAGDNLSAGGDLNSGADILKASPQQRAALTRAQVAANSAPIARAIHALTKPLIVSARGHAIGIAFMFVAAADLVIASDTAKFAFPYIKLGHSMDHGESFFVLRKLGMARTMQMMLTGETVGAADAERYGMINWVTPDADLDDRTAEIANRLATGAAYAIQRTKALLRDAPGNDLETQLAAESESVGACSASEDFQEAITAFFEKRKPVYKGR